MTVPSSPHALATGACVALLLLTACGGATATVTPSSSTTASASPGAESTPFAAAGFHTSVPAGWQDQTADPSAVASSSGGGTVLMVLTAPDHGVVVARTTPQPVADDQLAQYLTSITPAGATDVSQAQPIDVDGVSGVFVTFVGGSPGAAAAESEDMVVNQAGNTYEITLNASQPGFTEDSTGLQEILNTWTWD